MQIVSSQPATHSLLRSSQARRQSQSSRVNQNTQSNNEQKRQQTKDKYHFNYDGSIEKKNHNNKVFVIAANCESEYVDKQAIRQRQNSLMRPKQEIVVCKSLPHSRPKYSFTFNNMIKQHQINNINININNNSSESNPQIQQKPPQPNNISKDNQSQPHFQSPVQSRHLKQTPRTSNIRKDIDICLYTITDKLRQLQQKQYPKQSSVRNSFIGSNGKQHQKQKDLIKQPMRESQIGQGYRPSLTQMRKNSRKMWMDNSIHRIQPQIVEEYIETVYRDYNIPNPISGQGQISQRRNIQNQVTILPFNTNGIGQQVIQHQQHQQTKLNLNQSTNQQQIKQPTTSPKPCSPPTILPSKPQLSHDKMPASPKNRQSHLINKQKQNLKPQTKHRNRRSFLELTLSKDKTFKTKKFDSPPKRNLRVQDQKEGPSKQLSKQKSENSRSRSRVRQSQSQRKVQEIKKNIAQWKDSQHQFAERYSYLQSPYQVIRQQNRTTHDQKLMNRSYQGPQAKVHTQQQNKGIQPQQQINIKILPFQSLNTQPQTQPNEPYKQSSYTNTKQITSHNNSTYHQSFYSQNGQVLEEFRYCLLCEAPVLSVNIWVHERKCIGWINRQGRLYQFAELYKLCSQQEVKQVVRGKVEEIRDRIAKMIQGVRKREERKAREQGAKEEGDRMKGDKEDQTNDSQSNKDHLSHTILTSVQSLINSFDLTQSHSSNLTHHHNLTQSFTHLQQTTRQNPYLTMLQQSSKFQWFIKLLQAYEQRLVKKARNVESSNQQKKKTFSSTKARNNLSMTLVEEQAQPITQWSSKKPYN